jgi:hypothetical protein
LQPPADVPAADDTPPDAPPPADPDPARPTTTTRRRTPAQRPVPSIESPPEPAVGAGPTVTALTERELAILAFERQWWRHAGAKEQAIRDTFDISATRYYQLLNGLLDNPAALAAEPMLVVRLRRLRAARDRDRGT